MDSKSFWDDYFQKTEFGFQLTLHSEEKKQTEYLLPGIFHTWCKGNINNAKFLLASILRELLFENETNILVSVSLGNRILPIDIKGFGDFRIGAKNLIKEAALQSEHVDFLEIQNFSGILIAEFDSCLGQKSPIKLLISPDLNSISVKFKSEFEEFTIGLIENILHLIDPELIPSPKEFAVSGKQLIKDQNDFNQTKHAIISNAWNSVFEQKIDWDKNYYSNGGDSIQAIRFISKIKSSGWNGEFGELLSARKISEWEINPALNETENQDLELENSYPLSEMQQKIWTQSTASSKGIYHEQFLFELDKFPEVYNISGAYTEIWNSFPQLRIKIEQSGNSWRQTVVDFPADFRALEIDQSPEIILINDIEEGFTNQLMRCIFFKFDKKSYLLWSHHHILLDGWSVGILIQRFIRLIDGEIINHDSKNYQHLLVKKELEFVSKNHYPDWETFFKNYEAQHFSSNGTRSSNFDVLTKENHYSKLNEFCQDKSCTPQQVFLTALSIVNYALTGQSNSYIHGISSGRSIIPEHAETAIGLFIKNIIPSWKWNPSQTLDEIIDSVKKGQQFSIENEYVSYDYLNQFHNEIPDVLFVFENYPYNKVEGKNISGNLIFNQELTGYPFTLLIMPDGKSFQIKVIYDNGLFSQDFVKHVIDSISICVEKMLVVSDCSVEELFQLNEVEEPLNKFPDWSTRIEKQLEDFGDQKIINGFSHNCISFKEVIDLSEKLNFVLDGLNPQSRIALLGIKNEFTPALVYSIMKCGFTYVPINPSWPVDRINEVLRIANCQAIIIPDERTDLPDLSVRKIQLNQILSASKKKSHITIESQSEAYVLFTSGSTGEPKGVQLTHANLSSFLDACSKEVNLNDFDFIFSLTNLGFDLSIFENLFGLYSNKTTVVIPEIEHLETCLINYPGGLLNTVPSMIGKLQNNEIVSLKVIHTAGEPFTEQLWSKLKKINPNLKIVNWYGPTETTTYSTHIDLSDSYSSSIGTALLNENISVRDFLFCKLPEGIEGEVTIGGHGVASGYINSDSGGFVTKNNLRFYKTGDRGIIRDGKLFLKGRNDKQVKRLGQRFELGEVEQEILRTFPETKRTIYIHQNGKFALFIEGSSLDKTVIESHLSKKFPAYMRPDRTFVLEAFPENANGKIDVKSLIDDYIQNFKEELLGENDSELLNKLRQIDLFSSLNGNYGFIEQGGDSIVGLRLIGKLKTWGYQAEINNLLNASTLDDFIQELSASEKMNFVANKTDLTPIQQWFLNDFQGNKNHYNQSVLLEVLLPIETNILVGAIQKTLQNFKLLSQTFSDTWQDGIAPKTEYFKCESEDEITKKCSVIQESFDLKTGPVAGSAVFELQDKKLFFISIHHFYCDGYSWRLILDELQQVLNFGGTEHHSNQVFGKVYQRFLDLGKENEVEDKKHYGESIQNPFSTWNVVDYAQSSYVEWEWPENETRWFQFNDEIGKSTNEKFLYLFVKTWQKLNLPASTFFFETHGRSYDGIPEITDSIGWFTQFYPTFASRFPDKNNLLIEISEELKNLPNNGLTYMAMENWNKPPFPVLLNFLGNFDEESSSIVRSSKISQGKMTDDLNPMLSFVELNAMIFEGKLKWMLRSHPNFDCESFKEVFNTITKESIDIENSVSHVSDQIDQDDLDAINDLLGGM
jgi:acyl-CoA synthetase (AMP-forming)/AMP-acid ligase II/aryl carrier-like protein